MKNLSQMMKKAQEMQDKMAAMQGELENLIVEGEAGAGLVKVTLNGKGDMRGVKIDDSLFSGEEKDVVEDLIVAAHKAAKSKVQAAADAQMKELTGGMPLPDGFKMPF